MTRLRSLPEEALTDQQRRVRAEIASSRASGLGGPFSVLFRVPDLASPANMMHNELRLHSRIGRRALEFIILLVAARYNSSYVRSFHILQSRKIGIEDPLIEELCVGTVPSGLRDDEHLICELIQALLQSGHIPDDLFEAARLMLPEDHIIEVVAAAGFYSMICFLVNAFQVPGVPTA
jgi:alkylhydroperoxidase family enzyme